MTGLLQLRVFGLSGDKDGNVRVSVFPKREEILIGRLGFGGVALPIRSKCSCSLQTAGLRGCLSPIGRGKVGVVSRGKAVIVSRILGIARAESCMIQLTVIVHPRSSRRLRPAPRQLR